MNKIAKNALILMISTIIAKSLGFVRELVLASSYGASMYSDAYLTAMNIPSVVFAIIGSTLSTVLIPLYFEVNNNKGEKNALKFINNICNMVVVLCILLTIIGLIFTEELVKIFALGFDGEILNVTVDFTRVTIISIIFNGLTYIMVAYLQIKNNFVISGLVSLPRNIIIITSIIISLKYNPYIMIWGTLLGIAIELLFLLPFSIKHGYKYQPYLNIKDEYSKKMMMLIGPVLIGVAVNQINTLVDRTLASTLAEGSISALNYANRLNTFVMALIITSIGAAIYPMISKLSREDDRTQFINTVVKSINSVVLILIPISAGAMTLSTPIVKLLFERGAFDSRATSMTSIALTMYSIGMVAFGLRDILSKVFYATQDTKTPMINGAISMVMNVILNIILVRYLGMLGLALATSISSIICILLLFNSLNKKLGYYGQDKIIKTILKSIISAIIMSIITHFGYNLLSKILGNTYIYGVISLFGSILLGIIVYGVLILALKVDELEIIGDIFKKRKNKVA